MRRLFTAVWTVVFALSVARFAVAADNAVKAAPGPATEKKTEKAPAPAEKKASMPAKPKSQQSTGTIEAVDAAAGTFTLKGKKGNVELSAGEKVKLGDIKVGDKVVVKYSEGKASSVKVVKVKTAEKKAEAKPAEKKAPAPAAAAPAPAPAPQPAEKK
jgi:hypothetical protein